MTITLHNDSKCDRCNCPALKHLDFGLRIAEALTDGRRISTIPYASGHLNLCSNHLNKANVTYVHYAESDLGHCPIHLMA